MPVWKPTPAEKRTIREYAAHAARTSIHNITLEAGERTKLADAGYDTSINVLLVDPTEDWEESDLYTHVVWSTVIREGVPLTEDGRAVTDWYVYAVRDFGSYPKGELLINVQTYVETVDGTPCLVKLTGTATAPVYGSDL